MIPPSGTRVRWRTMTGLLDSAELRLVVLRVDVNVLRLSGALAVGIDRHLARAHVTTESPTRSCRGLV
jgi:hypothetical protein